MFTSEVPNLLLTSTEPWKFLLKQVSFFLYHLHIITHGTSKSAAIILTHAKRNNLHIEKHLAACKKCLLCKIMIIYLTFWPSLDHLYWLSSFHIARQNKLIIFFSLINKCLITEVTLLCICSRLNSVKSKPGTLRKGSNNYPYLNC